MSRVLSAVAAAALVLSASAAHAAAQSSATISGLTFTLIDLNPNDGITPSFSFLTTGGATALTVTANDTAVGESDSLSRTRPSTFSFSQEFLADLTHAGVRGAVDDKSLSVAGYANGLQTSYSASASTGVNPSNYNYYNQSLTLSLSANSLLLIDAQVSLTATAVNPQACAYYYYCNGSYGAGEMASASASSYLSYNYTGSPVSSTYNSNQTLSLQASARGEYSMGDYVYDPKLGYYSYVFTTYPKREEDKQLNDVLRNVFSNSSNVSQSAAFGLSVAVTGQATTAGLVPEPSSYLLFAQGLIGGAWLVARRRRQQA
jgi:hypothetical protein